MSGLLGILLFILESPAVVTQGLQLVVDPPHVLHVLLVGHVLVLSVLGSDIGDVVLVLFDVGLSELSVFVQPEERLELGKVLLDNEQSEEREEVSHDGPELWGLLGCDHFFSPEVEHQLNDVEGETDGLGGYHEGVTDVETDRQPNDDVADVDAGQGHIDSAHVSSLDDFWHVHEGHCIGCHTEKSSNT